MFATVATIVRLLDYFVLQRMRSRSRSSLTRSDSEVAAATHHFA